MKVSAKAVGVVIDDTAVTPQYVSGLSPKRELPIIGKIAKASLINKLVVILPVALLLTWFAPQVLPFLLVAGGAYLCFEGGEKVLDVGTGSGILGITALKLGAREVFGTDLDENAIVAVGENLEANGIGEGRFTVVQGNIIDDKEIQDKAGYECYDVAVANILADVIILLQKEIPVHIKKGGIFITSGIINMKEQAVREAFAANDSFEVLEVTYQGEWVSVTARRVK